MGRWLGQAVELQSVNIPLRYLAVCYFQIISAGGVLSYNCGDQSTLNYCLSTFFGIQEIGKQEVSSSCRASDIIAELDATAKMAGGSRMAYIQKAVEERMERKGDEV